MDVQSSKCKNNHENDPLTCRDLELPDEWHRDQHNKDICRNVEGGIGKPKRQSVHARALPFAPEELDRNAHKCGTEESPETVHNQDPQEYFADLLDCWDVEDSLVLEDDGEFAERQG